MHNVCHSGIHANPCFSGMTVRAWSEVMDDAETDPDIGALGYVWWHRPV